MCIVTALFSLHEPTPADVCTRPNANGRPVTSRHIGQDRARESPTRHRCLVPQRRGPYTLARMCALPRQRFSKDRPHLDCGQWTRLAEIPTDTMLLLLQCAAQAEPTSRHSGHRIGLHTACPGSPWSKESETAFVTEVKKKKKSAAQSRVWVSSLALPVQCPSRTAARH